MYDRCVMEDGDLLSGASLELIGSTTSAEDIIIALARRGCADLTSLIDVSACSNFPLAGGGFCNVYQGATNDGITIAIKSLRLYDRPGKSAEKEKILKRAAKELYHWSKLKHPNVLPLMGVAMFRGHMSMVSEWMGNGSLMSYIGLNPNVNRINLCLDVCAGLSYIHAKGMVHGDLKAANVMVSRNGTALIADFGNSQLKDLTLKFTNTTSTSLSVRWAAPELLEEDDSPHVSKEADIYAFGMTMLETLTGKVPYDDCSEQQVLLLVAVNHKTPDRPVNGVCDEMWALLLCCWASEQTKRPVISGVKERLLGISTDLAAKQYYQGRLREAESLYNGVVAFLKQEHGEYHPQTLQAMTDLAVTYLSQGRPEEAESLGAEVMVAQKRVLGEEHPETLKTMTNLSAAYINQVRLTEAESLGVTTLAMQKRVLGDHPDTFQTMANLATTYVHQGRLAEAESLDAQVVAGRKRVLGPSHRDTLRSMRYLADTYKAQGKHSQCNAVMAEIRGTMPR